MSAPFNPGARSRRMNKKKDLTKTAVVRQAIRLYQMIEARVSAGEKLVFEDEKAQKKAELMVL